MMDTEIITLDLVAKELESYVFPDDSSNVILFGAGLLGQLAVPLLKDDLNLIAFCDNSRAKQGNVYESLPCIAPEALSQYSNPFILNTSLKHYTSSIRRQLEKMNVRHCNLDAYVVCKHFDQFNKVYQELDNDESKRIYAGILYSRITGNMNVLERLYTENQYFCLPQFRFIGMNDVFVDCGAFTGDIVGKILDNAVGQIKRIYAFEPQERVYCALQKRVSFLKDIWALSDEQIVCEKKGVGDKQAVLSFRQNTAANLANVSLSSEPMEGGNVEVVSLDEYFKDISEDTVTYIKADIEGFEWNMLHGAEQLIRKNRPKMAISIYHNIYDFYRIPQYIKSLVPEYRFAVRHHWNSFDETVLYCYI